MQRRLQHVRIADVPRSSPCTAGWNLIQGPPPDGTATLFMAHVPKAAEPRRSAYRYPPVYDRALVAWWRDGKHIHTPARIIDISQNGVAAVVAAVPPLPPQSIMWIGLEPPAVVEWAETRLVAIERAGKEHQVRLSFPDSCPYDFFKIVVWGPDGTHFSHF